jgi:6-phosphogluconolactonase
LYSASETGDFEGEPGGGVYAYSIDPASRELHFLNARSSQGGSPCYVTVSPQGGDVLVANYSGGNVALLPIQPDGSLGPASDVEQHEGSSVNEQRQKGPHAHCIVTDSAGGYAFSADLGIDRVLIYRLEEDALTPAGHALVAPGAGPRHFTFHPDGDRAYVINELNSTVTAFAYEDGALEETQTIGTLPDGFDGDNFPADIHVSSDGRFVYGSNRGHDSIVVFGIDPDSGMLSPVQHEGTGGEWPRNFALDPTGRFLLAANQRTNNIVVFSIDSESGRLTPTGQTLEIPSPVCVRFLV